MRAIFRAAPLIIVASLLAAFVLSLFGEGTGAQTTTPAGQQLESQGKWGDADCNGLIDAHDAMESARDWAGFGSAFACIGLANVNCDFGIDGADVVLLLKWHAGLPYELREGCPRIGTTDPTASPLPNTDTNTPTATLAFTFPPDSPTPTRSGTITPTATATASPLLGVLVEVGLLAEGDDFDPTFTNYEFVTPDSDVTYLVTIDNDSGVPVTVDALTDSIAGIVECLTAGSANVIGAVLGPDDADGPGVIDGGVDEIQCAYHQPAPSTSGTGISRTATVIVEDDASNTDADQDSATIYTVLAPPSGAP